MALLEPNSYFGKLVDAGLTEIGEKHTPTMVLTFEVTHHAQAGKWEPITEVRRDVAFFLTEKARETSFADLRAIGFNGDMDDPKFSPDLYEGTELSVEHEVYNGKTSERVRIAKLKPGRERKPVAKDVSRLLAAQFKQAAASSARPSTPPPAAPPGPAPAPATGKDPNEPPF
jgi:hypothetical protein